MMDASTMVERKLSGIYDRREIEIPYEWYENFVSTMHQQLEEKGITIDFATISNDVRVMAKFEEELTESIENYCGDPTDIVGDPWTFAEELFDKEIEAKRIEQYELMKKAHEKAASENELTLAIPVRPRFRARAIELLKAAGIYDEVFADNVEKKLEKQFGNDDDFVEVPEV
jgi:hypothetical protein